MIRAQKALIIPRMREEFPMEMSAAGQGAIAVAVFAIADLPHQAS